MQNVELIMNSVRPKTTAELNEAIARGMRYLHNNFQITGAPPINKDVMLVLKGGQKVRGRFKFLDEKYQANRVNMDFETEYSIQNIDITKHVASWEEIKE